MKSGEPAGQEPAAAFDVAQAALSEVERAQKPAKLLLDESWQPVALVDTGRLKPERLEVIAHHLVQHALRGRLRRIAGGRTTHAPAVAKRTPLGLDRDLRGKSNESTFDDSSTVRFLRTEPD